MQYLTNLNLNKNELQNAVLHPLASAPNNPKTGQVYYNSTDKLLYTYDGTNWNAAGSAQGLSNVIGTSPIAATTSGGTATISHENSGVIAGSYGSAATGSADAKLPSLTINGTGHVTAATSVDLVGSKYITGLTSDAQTQLNGKQGTISDLSTIRSGAALGATALQPGALDTYSTTAQMNAAIAEHHDDTKVDTSRIGASNGVAQLDSSGKVPSTQLPSYVDDVLEYNSISDFPSTGESGKIYIAKDTNKTYRWGGSSYTEISESLALGETSSTAYAGDKGKAVTDNLASHVANTNNPHSVSKSQVGLGNVGNFKAVSTEANQDLNPTEQSNARANIGAGTSSFSGSYTDLTNKPTIPTVNLNGSTTASPSFYAPTSVGTRGQVLTSNGSGAPTWQAAPQNIKKYAATNPALSFSGGAYEWQIPQSAHAINNNAIIAQLYTAATGEQVVADITVHPTTYTVTITIISDTAPTAGQYRIVLLG